MNKSKNKKWLNIPDKNNIYISDCIAGKLKSYEMNWILSFDPEKDATDEIKNFVKKEYCKYGFGKFKFFVIRDLYRYLHTGPHQFCITPENFWWYKFLSESNGLLNLRKLLGNNDVLCRMYAGIIAVIVGQQVRELEEELKKQMQNNQNNQGGQILCDVPTSVQSILQKMENKVENIVRNATMNMDGWGLGGGVIRYDDYSYLEVKLSESQLSKIKSIGRNLYGIYLSDTITQQPSILPKSSSDYVYYCIDELRLQKIASEDFVATQPKSLIYLDLFLDISGSMEGENIQIAKGVVKELLKKRIRFRKLYVFNDELFEQSNLKELFCICTTGGTIINNVIRKISKRSLIISDFEDGDIDIEELKRKKDKITIVHIDNKNSCSYSCGHKIDEIKKILGKERIIEFAIPRLE